MRYLLALAVGPVQDFIVTARRTRDLWFGSYLLSEISKAVAKTILDAGACTLIFPAPEDPADLAPDQPEGLSVANKIVALIEGDQQLAQLVADRAVSAARERLRVMRDAAFSRIAGSFNRGVAELQVDDMLEVYWAAVPLQDYPNDRARLEAILAARKATRDFNAVTWGSGNPKSSLDGQRESVIPEEEDGTPIFGPRGIGPSALYRRYRVRPGERLCGVGLLKRHGARGKLPDGEQYDRFFSTSHVAAQPLLERLRRGDPADRTALVAQYREALLNAGISREALWPVPGEPHPVFGLLDGHLLFEERLRGFFETPEGFGKARLALRNFLRVAADDRQPLPYYGLLMADGDHMGKLIDHLTTWEAHQRFSLDLSKFAQVARHVVAQKYQGWPVYAGGDEVLAFVPLHTALECAQTLVGEFSRLLEHYRFKDREDGLEYRPSLSIGLVAAHHLEPLQDVLELARTAVKAAKKYRAALGVTVSKRSGVDRTVSGSWGTLDRRLQAMRDLHQSEAVPDRAAYDLEKVAHILEPVNCEAARLEALRILKRKKAQRGRERIAAHHLTVLQGYLDGGLRVEEVADELIVSRIFAEAAELADLPVHDPVATA